MYATRVLSISQNGDFIDQSPHSIGNFYSGSHPPLLIWIGYFASLIFGLNSITLKLIPFVFSLFSILLLIIIGRNLFNPLSGIVAALVFSSNIIFNVFAKRFQFDIPYTFFILLSFYLFLLYLDSGKAAYNILGGIVFGLCLMVKILVGFYIPIIIFIFYLLFRKKINYRFIDLIIFTSLGVIIALPWHLYMLITYGQDFINYFFGFHIFDRAFVGVEHNTKGSGYLYHINYLLSIIPYSILIFISLVKDFRNAKNISVKKMFLIIWFMTGLVIITLFKTKLEVYILLILAPGSLILAEYLLKIGTAGERERLTIIILTTINIIWSLTFIIRTHESYKNIIFQNIFIASTVLIILTLVVFFILWSLSNKFNVVNLYYSFIFLFFIFINVLFLISIPEWDNTYEISTLKNLIDKSGTKNIVYIGSNYRANPQFSFYFKGLDIGWKNDSYKYELLDTKNGAEYIRNVLSSIRNNELNIIVERDNINRSEYLDSKKIIPEYYRLVYYTRGYELYQK
jgi:4-amino-4-deoxy-L-arabinose transferase-like glycosyltransferase